MSQPAQLVQPGKLQEIESKTKSTSKQQQKQQQQKKADKPVKSEQDPTQPPKKTRKRNRVPVSCVICRRRKVKCDKQKPQCSNCIKNNVGHLCHYIEPKWAKPLESESDNSNVEYIQAPDVSTTVDYNHDHNCSSHNSGNEGNTNGNIVKTENVSEFAAAVSESLELKKELQLLKDKIKSLETENIDLKKKMVTNSNSDPNVSTNSIRNSLSTQDSDDILDSIFNSNILFIAQKGNQYNIPITYQISVFSWMFMVKNDLYLNDLWMKILKLRQHYAYYYNSKGSNEKNLISHYKNYNSKLNKFRNSSCKNTNLTTSVISKEKTTEHTSKLKKFLEKSLNLENNQPVQLNKHKDNSNELEVVSSPVHSNTKPNAQLPNVCPVTNVVGICPIGNSSIPNLVRNRSTEKQTQLDNDASLPTTPGDKPQNHDQLKKATVKRKNDPPLKFNRCPVLYPNDTTLSSPMTPTHKKNGSNVSLHSNTNNSINNSKVHTPIDNSNSDSDDATNDPKVCPLMIGDAKSLFKEKLSKMNISAMRDSYNHNHSNSTITNSNTGNNHSVNNNDINITTNKNIANKKKVTAVPSPAKSRGTPVIPSGPSTPMSEIKPEDTEKLNNFVPIAMKPEPQLCSRQNSMKRPASQENSSNGTNNSSGQQQQKSKKLKTITPSTIKSINYNNTKQVISVIEQYLPSKKVVGLLIDRFFEKLYIYMPYVDEHSFKVRVYSILKSSDPTSQKIKLSSIGTQYCEEFLTLCLMLIIIRLSWLSLPEKSIGNLNQNELLLMKPENFVSFVLIDMVKEIFSNAKIMTKPSLIIFQLGLFLKIYSTVSPEDGFDTDDSYTRNSSYANTNNNATTPTTSATSTNANTTPILGANASSSSFQHQNTTNEVPGTPTSANINDLSGDLTNESPNMNSPNFISMLVQLARTIGLDRDPLNFKNFYPTPNDDEVTISRLFKRRHLWRKLWYGLLFITIEANLSLGDYKKGLPIELDLDPSMGNEINHSWDCRLPGGIEQGVLEKSFENGKILQRELCVVQTFRESIVSYRWIYKGMKLLFAVDKPPTTMEIENVVTKLTEVICEKSKYGFGIDLIMSDQEIVNPFRARNSSVWVKKYTKYIKVLRLKVHLIVKNMIFTLNYLLFLNHEQKLSKLLGQKNTQIEKIDKQRLYIERFFEASLLSAIENFKLFVQFMDDNNKVFPNCGTELLIYPFLMVLNHRSHEFLISLVLRVQQSSPVIMEVLKKNKIDPKELQKRLFTYLETFIERLNILTKNYYYAWVLKRLVKFFFNILTNSQKFFKLNFKRMNLSTKAALKKNPGVSTGGSVGLSKLGNKPTVASSNENSNIEKSAFEIAFGTSKLPPVTDFTHDDRREINFNPVISNSDILLNDGLPMNVILGNSNNLNTQGLGIGIETPENMNIQHQASIAGTNSGTINNFNISTAGSQSTVDDVTSRLFDNMAFDMKYTGQCGNVITGMTPTEDLGEYNGTRIQTTPYAASNRWNNNSSSAGFGEELNELFDDQFLNDIGGFAMETVDSGLLGLHRGLSTDVAISPTIKNLNQIGRYDEFDSSSNPLVGGILPSQGYGNAGNTYNNRGNININNDLHGDPMSLKTFSSSGKGEIYNSLNEIDFTNVDLNAPVDNMVYGFDLNLNEGLNINNTSGNANAQNGANRPNMDGVRNNSADSQQPGAFGQWNIF